uniref:OTU domain-containing protein n=1 Tax=Strongyloides venezuelensis TaxID=75913 RepID=A0A0K0FER1_STRVS
MLGYANFQDSLTENKNNRKIISNLKDLQKKCKDVEKTFEFLNYTNEKKKTKDNKVKLFKFLKSENKKIPKIIKKIHKEIARTRRRYFTLYGQIPDDGHCRFHCMNVINNITNNDNNSHHNIRREVLTVIQKINESCKDRKPMHQRHIPEFMRPPIRGLPGLLGLYTFLMSTHFKGVKN